MREDEWLAFQVRDMADYLEHLIGAYESRACSNPEAIAALESLAHTIERALRSVLPSDKAK